MDGQIRETLLSALLGVVQCLLSNFIYKRKPYRNITDKKQTGHSASFQDHGFSHCYTLLWPSLKFALTKTLWFMFRWCLPKSSMPLAALLCAWSPTFADSFIAIAVKMETLAYVCS